MTQASPTPDTEPAKPCADPKASEFDFWLGEWTAEWGEDGRGTNVVTKALGGCVVLENFTDLDLDPRSLVGMSVSTYVARESCWKQTWVDNQGSYLDFKGGMTDEGMVLSRQRNTRERRSTSGWSGTTSRRIPLNGIGTDPMMGVRPGRRSGTSTTTGREAAGGEGSAPHARD